MDTLDALFVLYHPKAYNELDRLNAFQALLDNGEVWHRATWIAKEACALMQAGKIHQPDEVTR